MKNGKSVYNLKKIDINYLCDSLRMYGNKGLLFLLILKTIAF